MAHIPLVLLEVNGAPGELTSPALQAQAAPLGCMLLELCALPRSTSQLERITTLLR